MSVPWTKKARFRVWYEYASNIWRLRNQFNEFEAAADLCLHLEENDVPWVLVDCRLKLMVNSDRWAKLDESERQRRVRLHRAGRDATAPAA